MSGRAPVGGDGRGGRLLTPFAVCLACSVILGVERFGPSLNNVAKKPLAGLLGSPRDAWLFALVVVVAGGVVPHQPRLGADLQRHIAVRDPELTVHLLDVAPVSGALALARRSVPTRTR